LFIFTDEKNIIINGILDDSQPTCPKNTHIMKTLPKEHPLIKQEVISNKLVEMLSVLEKRNQFIAVYRKKYGRPVDIALKTTHTAKGKTHPK
jgi:hypothetical protein